LKETDLPVDKIARRCGMGNGDRLATIFRKRFELSPTAYRNLDKTALPDAAEPQEEARVMPQALLDVAKLDWISRELSESYSAAAPFPHVCIDNFLDDGIYREASAAFPSADEKVWFTFRSAAENLKLQIQDFYAIPPALRSLIVEFNSPGFIRFLEQLSGIQG
ncbi:AraC family transcriptional regulator, partial [Pseudomonas sp. KB_15]